MMKTSVGIILGLVCGLFIATVTLWAADFSTFSTDELAALRGTLRSDSAEARAAFRAEWQERLQNLTPQDRQKYLGPPENRPAYGRGNQFNAPSSGYGQSQRTKGGACRGGDGGKSKGKRGW
ncbi:hypothetical protein [Desulfosarcina alkanivorans]|jgi:hypothetical protein|uniref:hypothetical protein n=1 Tax=Desulfosarcina alkanivorans TaxID=571177 RepID=UPI0012D2A5D6|nr:hypothetical protein [Desulfosarcina alkanivorans]